MTLRKKMGSLITAGMTMVLTVLCAPTQAGPPYNVDDPGTADYQHIEENTSYTSNWAPGSGDAEPATELNYGYSKNIQLTLGSGLCSQRLTGARPVTGMADTGAEFKWRFREEDARNPGLSLHYFLKIPTASEAEGLGTGHYDHALLLSAGKQFRRVYAFGDFGPSLPGGPGERKNLVLGSAFSYQLTPVSTVGGQIYGNTSAAAGDRGSLSWGVTATRDLLPGRTLMLQVGRNTMGSSNLNVYTGIQFILDTRQRGPGVK